MISKINLLCLAENMYLLKYFTFSSLNYLINDVAYGVLAFSDR